MTKIRIGKSGIAGRGIFASTEIKKDDFVAFIEGKVVYKVYKTKSDLKIGKTWISIGKHKWLCPISPIKYMNHSCDSNLGFKTPRKLYARRNIERGEELTIDYSTVEYVDFWSLPCSCGSEKCRGEMKSIQFLPKKIYEGYLPYIPRFFQAIYLQYKKQYGRKAISK